MQLNPFELKTTLVKVLSKIKSVADISKCLDDIELLGNQENKILLSKLLFKELINCDNKKMPVICFLLEQFLPPDIMINGLWNVLKNKSLRTDVRVMVLNLIRELDADYNYEDCLSYIDDAKEVLDENTKQLLNTAVINPEVQIDFMDFLATITVEDKITLLNSFEKDFDNDSLANILIPVLQSNPYSPEGKEALRILGQTKSVLGLHILQEMLNYADGELNQLIRKSLATLKMSGIREDNSSEFYKKILSNSIPQKFHLTYPDAYNDVAMIFTRITDENKIRFISIVANLDTGIKDCFGFYEISQFESDKIIEKFLKNEQSVTVIGSVFKNILFNAECINRNNNNKVLSYEYVCWKNLLIDIESENILISDILKNNITPCKIDDNFVNELGESRLANHWFLDSGSSEGFTLLLKNIKSPINLENLLNNYFNQIFDEKEILSWKKKIMFCAYIKYSSSEIIEAQKLYSLLLNENLFSLFLENILKRSIYEYFVFIKYNKEFNNEMFTDEDISNTISYIEKNWVKSNV